MDEADSPCRLFVYLARDAPIGVVLRRGPSDWARLSVWHTDRDAFEHGQWFKGRVYERRSDLSADGSLFVYFARRSAGPSPPGEHRDTWAAISRPPWFTALALWFVGGTYYTGGFFPDRHALWLGWGEGQPDQGQLPSWLTQATGLPPYVDRTNDWTDRTVWLNRLLRDGWEPIPNAVPEVWRHWSVGGELALEMTLVSNTDFTAYGGRHVVEYSVHAEPEGTIDLLGRATWADWDQFGRLIVAQNGRLHFWQSPGTLREFADFNPQRPEPEPSPDWARDWPRPPRS